MNDSALWLIPAVTLKWSGLILGLAALLLLAELLIEHWQLGADFDDDMDDDLP